MAEAAKIADKTIPDDPITRYHVSTYERMNGWGQVFSVAGTVKCGCIYRSQEDANNNANDLSGDQAKEEKERSDRVRPYSLPGRHSMTHTTHSQINTESRPIVTCT